MSGLALEMETLVQCAEFSRDDSSELLLRRTVRKRVCQEGCNGSLELATTEMGHVSSEHETFRDYR